MSHHVVPPGHCWVEGDNGRLSNDSNNFGVVRSDHNGSQCYSLLKVPQGLIKARVRFVMWPPSRLHYLQQGLLVDQEQRLTIVNECNVT